MGFQVVLLRGTATRVSWEPQGGDARIAIGTQSEWTLHDPGIAANHVELFSDGRRLLVYAHGPDVALEQKPLNATWTEVSEGVLTVAGAAFRIVRIADEVATSSSAYPSVPAPGRGEREPAPLGTPLKNRDAPSRETQISGPHAQPSIRPRLGGQMSANDSEARRDLSRPKPSDGNNVRAAHSAHAERGDATHISLQGDSSPSHPRLAQPVATGKFTPPPSEPMLRPTTVVLALITIGACLWLVFGGRRSDPPRAPASSSVVNTDSERTATAQPIEATEAQTLEAAGLTEDQAALALIHGKVVVAALAYERLAAAQPTPSRIRLAGILKRRVRCDASTTGESCP